MKYDIYCEDMTEFVEICALLADGRLACVVNSDIEHAMGEI